MLIIKFNSYDKMLDKESILYIADFLVLVSKHYIYKEEHNISFDEKIRDYKTIQRFCSFYVLLYDFDSMLKKLRNIKDNC